MWQWLWMWWLVVALVVEGFKSVLGVCVGGLVNGFFFLREMYMLSLTSTLMLNAFLVTPLVLFLNFRNSTFAEGGGGWCHAGSCVQFPQLPDSFRLLWWVFTALASCEGRSSLKLALSECYDSPSLGRAKLILLSPCCTWGKVNRFAVKV